MSPFIIAGIAIGIFLILIFAGMPIGFAFCIVGGIGIVMDDVIAGLYTALSIFILQAIFV